MRHSVVKKCFRLLAIMFVFTIEGRTIANELLAAALPVQAGRAAKGNFDKSIARHEAPVSPRGQVPRAKLSSLPRGGSWQRQQRAGGETWKYTFTVSEPTTKPIKQAALFGKAESKPMVVSAQAESPLRAGGTLSNVPSGGPAAINPLQGPAIETAANAQATDGLIGVPRVTGLLPPDLVGGQIGQPDTLVPGVKAVIGGSAERLTASSLRLDSAPNAAVATLDIAAFANFMRSASGGGGVLLDPPNIGDTTYFYGQYTVTGTGGPITFQLRAVLDGVAFCAGSSGSRDVGFLYGVTCGPWIATAGNHTIQWDFDYTGVVEETNEANNSISKNFTPAGEDLVAKIAYLRTGANGGLIVDPPTLGQTVFFHLEWEFNGSGPQSNVDIRAVLDGQTHCSGAFAATPPSASTAFCNNGWVATAGTHTLQWDLDFNNTISELSEANNSVSKSISPGTCGTGLTITPTFDPAVTTAEQALIYSAMAFYCRTFADPINVTIKFQRMASGLGQSSTTLYFLNYSTFRTALFNDKNPASADDALAFANGRLPASATNPVDGHTQIDVKTANIRAAGVAGSFPPTSSGGFDGIISFNNALVDLNGGPYSLFATIQHEIDEVLGMGSILPNYGSGQGQLPDPSTLDLFRYTSTPNLRSPMTTNPSGTNPFAGGTPQSFFSIDGTTHLNEFNNCNNGGDYGDWITHTPSQVQDAFTNASFPAFLTLGSDEVRALDVIGYNVVSTSAPHRRGQVTGE